VLNTAIAPTALIAPSAEPLLAFAGPKFAEEAKKSPMVAMKINGMNFNTVVSTCQNAMFRSPARLIIAGNHSPAKAIAIGNPKLWGRGGALGATRRGLWSRIDHPCRAGPNPAG